MSDAGRGSARRLPNRVNHLRSLVLSLAEQPAMLWFFYSCSAVFTKRQMVNPRQQKRGGPADSASGACPVSRVHVD